MYRITSPIHTAAHVYNKQTHNKQTHTVTANTHSNSKHSQQQQTLTCHSPTKLPAETLATIHSLDSMYLQLQTPVRNFTVLEICNMEQVHERVNHHDRQPHHMEGKCEKGINTSPAHLLCNEVGALFHTLHNTATQPANGLFEMGQITEWHQPL